jgi:hypothetical protein
MSMRVAVTLVLGSILAFGSNTRPVAAQAAAQQDADRKVAGGGITVPGWTGKEDAGNKQGLTVKDGKLAPEGNGFRLTTGPAALYWNPANVGKGDFSVKATFTEPKQTINHPHPYGVFIGGSDLDSGAPNALYCTAYRNGTYIIRMFSGGKRVDIVGRPMANDAVKKAEPDAPVVQDVQFTVRGDAVQCLINGTAVWSGTKADVTGPGKLPSTDGIVGIRVSHNADAVVTNFALGK